MMLWTIQIHLGFPYQLQIATTRADENPPCVPQLTLKTLS